MFVEPMGAFFQHFNDDAEHAPVDPRDLAEWEAAGNALNELTGYLKTEVVFQDDGQTSAPVTRLEFQVPKPAFDIRRDHTLRVGSTIYRIRNAPDHSGILHIGLQLKK